MTKKGIKKTRSQVSVDNTISEKFEFMTGLEQGDVILLLLIKIA